MTDNPFDKFIKDKLSHYPSPVPDGLWEKIRQEKDRKPVATYWWKNYGYLSAIGISGILLCSTLFLLNNSNSRPATKRERTQQAITGNNKQAIKSTSPIQQPKTTNQTETPSNAVADNEENRTQENLNINHEATSSSTDKKVAPGEEIAGTYTRSKKAALNLRPISKGRAASGNINYFPGSLNSRTIIKQGLSTNNYRDHLSKPVYLATAEMDRMKNELSGSDLIRGLKEFKLFSMDCPPARGPIRNDIYIEVYGSPDYAKKTVNNAGPANAAFLQLKDSTESMRLSYTAGFRITKAVGEHLLLKAGLQYSQINEKFSYRNENERRLTTVITIRTVVRPAGDTVIVRDTSTVEQIGYRVKTTYNRYRSIDVPLLVGYEWGNDNFKVAVTGGVILNIYSWQKGESLDTTYLPVAFNKSNGQTFKQNVGVGLYAGFSLLKKTGERTELFMEPYFRYNISNMTNNKSLFNQKFQVAGINMGIRYKLNGFRQR